MSWTEVMSMGGSSSELSSPLEPINRRREPTPEQVIDYSSDTAHFNRRTYCFL